MSARTANLVRLDADTQAHPGRQAHRPVAGVGARRALLVLGMHRSGTSAITRVLNLLGAELGRILMPGDADNASGYWENQAFVKRNELLLRMLGMSWHAPVRMPPGWDTQPQSGRWVAMLQRCLQRQLGSAPLVAIKDPRLCRLAPLWMRALEDGGFQVSPLLVLRDPREVAGSLARRNGFSIEKSYLLWLQHVLDAEAATRARPRVVIDYRELLADWNACIDRIESATRLRWPRSRELAAGGISGFLDPSLRHHDHRARAAGTTPGLLDFVHDVHARMLRSRDAAGTAPLPTWDDFGEDYMRLVEVVLGQSNHDLADITLRHERLEHRLRDENRLREVARHAQVGSAELRLWTERTQARQDQCKLYWRQDGFPYREAATATMEYGFGQQRLQFSAQFADGRFPDFVRIDPSEWPGLFVLDRFRVDADTLDDPGALLSEVEGLRLEGGGGEIRFAGFGDDPHIELDLRGFGRGQSALGPARLSFDISCIGLQSEITRIAERSGNIEATLRAQQGDLLKLLGLTEIMAGNQDQHADLLDTLAGRTAASLSDLEHVRQGIEAHGRTVSALLEGAASAAEASRSDVEALYQRIDARSRQAEEAMQSIESQLDAVRGLHARVDAQTGAIQSMLAEFGSRLDRLGDEQAGATRSMLAELGSRLDRLGDEQAGATRSMLAEFGSRLDRLGDEQAVFRVWAQRRSPSYWWRRWRR